MTQASNQQILQLTDREVSMGFLNLEAISSLTWYEGKAPLEFLQTRMSEILAANPWLAGRFVKKNGRICIEYPFPAAVAAAPHFNVLHVTDDGSAKAEKLDKTFAPFCVKKATQSIGKDEPVFRVLVAQHSGPQGADRFAILFSLSHTIADGPTFYNLYRMLSSDQSARALIAERDESKVAAILQYMGEDDKLFKSMGFMCNMLGTMMSLQNSKLASRSIESSWIATQKAQGSASSAGKFVSTNDVLTSFFFKQTKADLGMMAIDFRNRIPGLVTDYAGNYEAVLYYQPEDFASAQLIRASLDNGRCKRTVTGPILPGFMQRCKATISIISNWCGFYYAVQMPGCNEVLHTPYFKPHKVPMHFGLIYKMNKDTTALMTVESMAVMHQIQGDGALGPQVDVAQYC
jgi:hypothetical protein